MLGKFVFLALPCAYGLNLLTSYTQIKAKQRFTVSEIEISQDDVQTLESSVVEFALDGLATSSNTSGTATARLSFSAPVSEWQRRFVGYIPEDIESAETSQCVQLQPPFLKKLAEEDFDEQWSEWVAKLYREDREDTFRVPTVDFSTPNRRTLAQVVCLDLDECKNFDPRHKEQRYHHFEKLQTNCIEIYNYWLLSVGTSDLECPEGKNRFVKQQLEPPPYLCRENPLNWVFICLENDESYIDLSTSCGINRDSVDCGVTDPRYETCSSAGDLVSWKNVSNASAQVAANAVGIGNFFRSNCIDQKYLKVLHEITKQQYNKVFSQAPGVYSQILQQELEADDMRKDMMIFLRDESEKLNKTLMNQDKLSLRISTFSNATLQEFKQKKKTLLSFTENFLTKREDFKKEWSKGFSNTLEQAENRANQLDQEAQFLFSLLGTLDIVSLRQRELIFDLTEEIDGLLRSARVALRDTNEIRTGRQEKRLANALVWSYADFLLQTKSSQGLSGWSWLKSRGSRPKGRVGLREVAQTPWHRFTFVQQHDWTDGSYASTDPWIQQRIALDNADAYLDYMRTSGTQKWLDVVTFEFFVNPDYLLQEIDTWFTFEDIKAMLGPPGCFPPEIKGGSVGVAPLPPGREYCRGWVKVKRSRCARGDEPFWQPFESQNAFLDLNASAIFEGPNSPCFLGEGTSLQIKTDLFFNRQTESLVQSSSSGSGYTGFPEIELVTSSLIVDTYLELLCKSSLSTLYWNTGVLSLEPGTLGVFSPVNTNSKCSTYPTTMEVQSLEAGNLTLPYIFYKSGQLAAQSLFLGAQGQWEIDKYGALPDNIDSHTAHFTHPYGFQERLPSLERFFYNSEYHFIGTRTPLMPDTPPSTSLRCKKHGLAVVSPFMTPVWRISHLRSYQSIKVEVFTQDGQVLQNYTQDVPTSLPALSNSGDFLVAGYLECIHQPCQQLFDFFEEDLSAAVDPTLREHKATYFMLFLQAEYGQTLAEFLNETEKEPASNSLIDQNSHFALNLECSTKTGINCFSTTYFSPQPTPPGALQLWQVQNRLKKMNTRYLGNKGGEVRKTALQNPLTGNTTCQLQAANRKGTLCTWLDTEILQRSQHTLDTTPGGYLHSYRKRWSTALAITVAGAAFNGTFETVEGTRGCPSLQEIQLRPQLQSGDGVNQWVIALRNQWPTEKYHLSVRFSLYGGQAASKPWDDAQSWRNMNCTQPQTISKKVVVNPLSQKLIILPTVCQEEATLTFVEHSSDRQCVSFNLEKQRTQKEIISTMPPSTWTEDFFRIDLQDHKDYQAFTEKPDFEALGLDSKSLVLLELFSQRSKLELRQDLLASLSGICLTDAENCPDQIADFLNNYASKSFSLSKVPALLWGQQGVRSFEIVPPDLEEDDTTLYEILQKNVYCTQKALDSAFQTDLEINTVREELQANINFAQENLELVEERMEDLIELDAKIKEAYALLKETLTNIGPYETPLRNIEGTGRSTSITPTGLTVGNTIFLPGAKRCGFLCKLRKLNFKINLPSMDTTCRLLGVIPCESCGIVKTGVEDVPLMGELTKVAGKIKCLLLNLLILFLFGSFILAVLSIIADKAGQKFGKLLIGIFCCPCLFCSKNRKKKTSD